MPKDELKKASIKLPKVKVTAETTNQDEPIIPGEIISVDRTLKRYLGPDLVATGVETMVRREDGRIMRDEQWERVRG